MSDKMKPPTETEEAAAPTDWRKVAGVGRGRRRPRATLLAAAVGTAVTAAVGAVTVLSIREETRPITCGDLAAPTSVDAEQELDILVDGAGDAPPYLTDVTLAVEQAFQRMPADTPFVVRVAIVSDRNVVIDTPSPCLSRPLRVSSSDDPEPLAVVTKAIRTAIAGMASDPTAAPALWQQGGALAARAADERTTTVAMVGSWHLSISGQPATCGESDGSVAETQRLVRLCVEQGLLAPIDAEHVVLLETGSVNTAPEAKDAAAATRKALCELVAGAETTCI